MLPLKIFLIGKTNLPFCMSGDGVPERDPLHLPYNARYGSYKDDFNLSCWSAKREVENEIRDAASGILSWRQVRELCNPIC